MDRALAGREYASHLTDADLRLLAPAATAAPGDGAWLRGDPAALLRLLEDPGTFGTVLGDGGLGEGARWYRTACELAPVRTARLAVAGDVAGRFRQARRVLNHLADRYLLSAGQPWFTPPGA